MNVPAPQVPDVDEVTELRARLYEHGFRPIPIYTHTRDILSAGKRPLGDDWRQEALKDPPLCARSRAVAHALNTGILCDGLRAIDVDIDDRDVVRRVLAIIHEDMPEAPTRWREDSARVLLLYRAVEGQPRKLVVAGDAGKVEVLGAGQQFVAYGYHPNGALLQWMPEGPDDLNALELPAVDESQIHALLIRIAEAIGAEPPHKQSAEPRATNPDLTADIGRVWKAIMAIPNAGPADWEAWNRIGMAIWSATEGSQAGRGAFHAWSQQHPAYDITETDARWDHYATSPPTHIGAGTLFWMARGSSGPQIVDNDGEFGPEPPPPDDDGRGAASPAERPAALWADEGEWDEARISPRRWIAPGYYMRGAVTLIAGQGSAGKSMLAVTHSSAMALAVSWSNFKPVAPMRSIVYNVEDDADEQRRRYSAALRQFRATPAQLTGRVIRVGPNEIGTLLERNRDTGRLTFTPAMQTLLKLLDEHRPDVLFVDPLVELHNAEENDNTALRSVIARFRAMAVAYDMAVVILHHASKAGSSASGDQNMIRGAGSIVGAARVAITVTTMTEEEAESHGIGKDQRHDYFRVDGAKANYSRIGEPEWYRKAVYELANGDSVAAPVPHKMAAVDQPISDTGIQRAVSMIDAGPAPGVRYSASRSGAMSSRWVGNPIMKALSVGENQAKKIIATWHREGVLEEISYFDGEQRKQRKGVAVNRENLVNILPGKGE